MCRCTERTDGCISLYGDLVTKQIFCTPFPLSLLALPSLLRMRTILFLCNDLHGKDVQHTVVGVLGDMDEGDVHGVNLLNVFLFENITKKF